MLSVELPDVLIAAGLKLACMPLGNPLAVRDTLPVNPFSAPTLTVKLVLLPALIDCELGEAEIEKFGVAMYGVTITVTGVF